MDPNISQQPAQQNLPSEIPSSGSKLKWILLITVLLLNVGFGAYYLVTNKNTLITKQTLSENILEVYWMKYESKKLGFTLQYPTLISNAGRKSAHLIPIGIYENAKNNRVYIGDKNIFSSWLSGKSMYLPPVSVEMRHVNNDKELGDFIKEYGSDCILAQKKILYGGSDDENYGTVFSIVVDWNASSDGLPNCAMSDAHYKFLYREKNEDKRAISLVISAQECNFPAPGYGKNNNLCYDLFILDNFDFSSGKDF